MTSSKEDRMFATSNPRGSPPSGHSQNSDFFQTRQGGGRTVLPPFSAFPTSRSPEPADYPDRYTQSRPEAEHIWRNFDQSGPQSATSTAPPQPSDSYYEPYDRYHHPAYPLATHPTLLADPQASYKLPPFSVPQPQVKDDRWLGPSYITPDYPSLARSPLGPPPFQEGPASKVMTFQKTPFSSKTDQFVPQDLTGLVIKLGDQYCAAGYFADVYKCKYQSDQGLKEVAVKSFRFEFQVEENGENSERARMIRRELGIWRRLNHPNIVPFLGTVSGFGRLGNTSLVSLWMPSGTLQHYLSKRDDTLIITSRLRLLLDIANGLQYLHSLSIVHGDLSPNNVLLDENDTAKLTDFGLASLVGETPHGLTYLQASTMRTGTLRWAAPECFPLDPEEKPEHTTKSDIFSFGSIGLQVLSGKPPWSEIKRDIAILHMLSQGRRPSRPQSRPVDDMHWVFIEYCWSPIKDRPPAERIVSTIQDFLHSLWHPEALSDPQLSSDRKHVEPMIDRSVCSSPLDSVATSLLGVSDLAYEVWMQGGPGMDSSNGLRAFIHPYLDQYVRTSNRLAFGERTIIVMSPKVAQKSYGTEKRFLCPPPTAIMIGNSWWTNVVRRGEEPNLFPPRVTVCISDEPVPQEGTVEWTSASGKIFDIHDAPMGTTYIGRCVGKQLYISDVNEKKKRVEALVRISAPSSDYEPERVIGTFPSRSIKVISKPSKRRRSARNLELCINHGSTISLFHRLRSQTVSTRYLCVSGSGLSFKGSDGAPLMGLDNRARSSTPSFIARTTSWDPLIMYVADVNKPSGGVDALPPPPPLPDYPSPPPNAIPFTNNGSQIPIYYNQTIVLQCLVSGVVSPVLIIRKVDHQTTVVGGGLEKGAKGIADHYCAPGEVCGDPVSQLHKIAFEVFDATKGMPEPGTPGQTGAFLSCMGRKVNTYRPVDGRQWNIPQNLRSSSPILPGSPVVATPVSMSSSADYFGGTTNGEPASPSSSYDITNEGGRVKKGKRSTSNAGGFGKNPGPKAGHRPTSVGERGAEGAERIFELE